MRYLSLSIPGTNGTPTQIEVPGGVPTIGTHDLSYYVSFAITAFLLFLVVTSLIYLLWGGFRWIQSEGDPKNVDSARRHIIFAIIGLLLGVFSIIIVNTITGIFGVTTK